MTRPLVVLELNELCPPLIDRFIVSGDLPNFQRLRDESVVYTTDAEESQEHLNPWIQWVTAHTGVGFDRHGIYKLGEGDRLDAPTVADVVSSAGQRVWLCGPMNVVPTAPVRGRWLPDPWNPRDAPVPGDLADFAAFVRANVQEHSNPSHRLSSGDVLRFARFMSLHGLSRSTVAAVVAQLAGERLGRVERWKRVALLDRFQWDQFRHFYRRERPALATYFSNTTAHFQHRYWRYMDPSSFALALTAEDQGRFADAVPFGYREMDRLVGQAMALVGDDATLVLCTALSQQPYVAEETSGGKRFYRPHDCRDLVERLGVVGVSQVAPVMSEQFHLFFESERGAASAEQLLRGARVLDRPAFGVRRAGNDLFMGFSISDDLPAGAEIVGSDGARLPVQELLYRAETPKSGYHHPDGAFWIRTGSVQGVRVGGRVSLRSVAPTLVRLLGLTPPASMSTPALEVDPTVLS